MTLPSPSLPHELPWIHAEEALAKLDQLNKALTNLLEAVKSWQLLITVGGPVEVPAPGAPAVKPILPVATPLLLALGIDDAGIASSGSETTLIDNTKYWETDIWKGAIVFMAIAGQLYITSVSSNTQNSLTFSTLPSGVKPTDTTSYALKRIGFSAFDYQQLLTKGATRVVNLASIAFATTSALTDCTAIDLTVAKTALAITVACTFSAAAVLGIRVHVRSSYDGLNYDTQDFDTWTPTFTAGAAIRATKVYDASVRYLKVLIENLDAGQAVTSVVVDATIRG